VHGCSSIRLPKLSRCLLVPTTKAALPRSLYKLDFLTFGTATGQLPTKPSVLFSPVNRKFVFPAHLALGHLCKEHMALDKAKEIVASSPVDMALRKAKETVASHPVVVFRSCSSNLCFPSTSLAKPVHGSIRIGPFVT
jgi:hypothetical protein